MKAYEDILSCLCGWQLGGRGFLLQGFQCGIKVLLCGFYWEIVEHAELAISNQTFLSVMEMPEAQLGNTMYFFFSFDDEKSINEAYEILKEGAEIRGALGPCEWCKLLTDLTDKYGIRWLLNVF